MRTITVEVVKTIRGTKEINVESQRDIMKLGFVEDLELFDESFEWSKNELISVETIRNEDGKIIAWCTSDEDGNRHINGMLDE